MENLEMKAITAARVANEESKARKRSFRDMMRIICERCPRGKAKELLLVGGVTKND